MLKTVKCRLKTSLLEWWQLISEKRCDGYAHSQEDEYNEAPKSFLHQA
jgi:hypothetical protein